MKKTGFFVLAFVILFSCGGAAGIFSACRQDSSFRNGDIIFQVTGSGLSLAIRDAMHSPYTHCGIICEMNGIRYVYEAVQPVRLTPWDKWIDRGVGGHYVVKRLRNASEVLTPEVIAAMEREGMELYGKDYDNYFNWSDERMYCSELVWKIYQRTTGIELGAFKKLGEFDLSTPRVREKMEKIFGDSPTLDEPIISPIAIFECDLLEEVGRRGSLDKK